MLLEIMRELQDLLRPREKACLYSVNFHSCKSWCLDKIIEKSGINYNFQSQNFLCQRINPKSKNILSILSLSIYI